MRNRIIVMCLLICTLLCGCNGGTRNSSFLGNVPDPEVFFSGSKCSKYSLDQLSLKGISIEYSGTDIKDAFESYVDECEKLDFWVVPVYDGSTSWCYQNEDRTLQIAINLYEDTSKIDVSVKTLE